MNFDFLALIVGGIGPDVWDKEANISAADFMDAAGQAQAKADEWGGQVVMLEQNDMPATPSKYGPENPPRLRKPGESVEQYRMAMGWSTTSPNASGNATERSEGRVDHNVGRRTNRTDF